METASRSAATRQWNPKPRASTKPVGNPGWLPCRLTIDNSQFVAVMNTQLPAELHNFPIIADQTEQSAREPPWLGICDFGGIGDFLKRARHIGDLPLQEGAPVEILDNSPCRKFGERTPRKSVRAIADALESTIVIA